MTHVQEYDAVVIGAGFAGIYMTHLLSEGGYSVRTYEAAENVGGTWYWNRYPGARCDTPSEFYSYTFSEELYKGWTWSSFYPQQEEILAYLNYAVDKLDIRDYIQFNTAMKSADYDEENKRWRIHFTDGLEIQTKYFIPAIGGLNAIHAEPHRPKIRGLENFKGVYQHTSRWKPEEISLKDKRVGVIGTGSTGVQTIIEAAKEAQHVTVFQRTPQYVLPVKNPKLSPDKMKEMHANFHSLDRRVREHPTGMPSFPILRNYSALDDTPEERQKYYEQLYEEANGFQLIFAYNDLMLNKEANETLAEFLRSKIKEVVKDSDTAKDLLPTYLVAAKRPIVAKGYFETFNQDNVSLVNLRKTPFVDATEKGLRTTETEHELDIIIFASGFDVGLGPVRDSNIRGRDGILLHKKWEEGANIKTYLGACHNGFPNLLPIGGTHYPLGVNVIGPTQVMGKWIYNLIDHFDKHGIEEIEPTVEAEETWTNHVNELGEMSFYSTVDSWFNGGNIEGKPRAILGYAGDFLMYQEQIAKSLDYKGFIHSPQLSNVTNGK